MDLDAAIRGRRSIRAFSGGAVSEDTVHEILDVARWTPSWANTQPWNVFVVTGHALEQIKAAYRQRTAAKVDRCFEIARPRPDWPPELAARTKQLMAARGRGLGTCIMASAVAYPDVLHAVVPGAAGERFAIGVALGVPDLGAPANQFDRPRADLSEVVSFVR